MKVLVIHSGGSSLGYRLVESADRRTLASGLVERIGDSTSILTHRRNPGTEMEAKIVFEQSVPDHEAGLSAVVGLITDPDHGVIGRKSEVGAVVHRVFDVGEGLHDAAPLDGETAAGIRRELARRFPDTPLMNEPAGEARSVCRSSCSGIGGPDMGFSVGSCPRSSRLAG